MSKAKINIQRLRDFAFSELPKNWILREILIREKSEIEVATFLARLPVWLQLNTLKRGEYR